MRYIIRIIGESNRDTVYADYFDVRDNRLTFYDITKTSGLHEILDSEVVSSYPNDKIIIEDVFNE